MKNVFASLLFGMLLPCVWTSAFAKSIERVDFPEEVTLGNQKLPLNGLGLRTKKKLGMNFKVYVAGLYLPMKSTDAKAILAGPGNKVLELSFLRSIDKETLQEAWKEGFDKNCGKDCEAAADAFKAFNDTMIDVRENYKLRMTFDKDGVTVQIKGGKVDKKAQIMGDPIRRALLAIFIGDEPPTADLKKGLLGG